MNLSKLLLLSASLLTSSFSAHADSESKADRDINCLALNIYHEARGEPPAGRLLVGLVTKNRVASKSFPNTICGVVWEKRYSKTKEKWVAQFSWTFDGRSDKPEDEKAWQIAKADAYAVYHSDREQIVNYISHNSPLSRVSLNTLYYHGKTVNPSWAKHFELVATIGRHHIYNE